MSTQPIPQPDNFQYVKMPDGSYGKFAPDASDDIIRGAIQKDFPSALSSPASESQSSAAMRFIKAAGSRLYAGTAGAGPQQSGTITQDFSQQEAQAKAGTLPSVWQTLKNSASGASPSNIDIGRTLSSVNPIDTQRFQSGDVAGGLGSSAANLLMLRQAFKSRGLPEFNAPNTSEIVQPLSGYTKAAPKPNVTIHDVPNYSVRPSQLTPQNLLDQLKRGAVPAGQQGEFPVTPADDTGIIEPQTAQPAPSGRPTPNMAIYDDAGMSNSATAQPKPLNKDTNTLAQEYFIQKMRDQMNRQTVTGSAEQDAAVQRMNEYAKTPFDRATPSTPQFAYRSRNAGETGVMPASGKQQASINPDQVQSYMEGRGSAENHSQELVRIDLSKLDPSEYQIDPKSGYVKFKTAVPESYIEKMGSKAVDDLQPRVPTSDADLQDLLMKSIQRVQAKAKTAKAGD